MTSARALRSRRFRRFRTRCHHLPHRHKTMAGVAQVRPAKMPAKKSAESRWTKAATSAACAPIRKSRAPSGSTQPTMASDTHASGTLPPLEALAHVSRPTLPKARAKPKVITAIMAMEVITVGTVGIRTTMAVTAAKAPRHRHRQRRRRRPRRRTSTIRVLHGRQEHVRTCKRRLHHRLLPSQHQARHPVHRHRHPRLRPCWRHRAHRRRRPCLRRHLQQAG